MIEKVDEVDWVYMWVEDGVFFYNVLWVREMNMSYFVVWVEICCIICLYLLDEGVVLVF